MREVIIEWGQHLVDICVQELPGVPDALDIICSLNNLEYDAELYAGQVLIVPNYDPENDVQQYFRVNEKRVNSHLADQDVDILGTNDNEGITDNDGDLIEV